MTWPLGLGISLCGVDSPSPLTLSLWERAVRLPLPEGALSLRSRVRCEGQGAPRCPSATLRDASRRSGCVAKGELIPYRCLTRPSTRRRIPG